MAPAAEEFRSRSEPFQEDMPFQIGTWRVQRVSWLGMALLIALASAGLFSGGPLSRARAAAASGTIEISYSRFARLNAGEKLDIAARAGGSERLRIKLSAELGRAWAIEAIHPAPVGVHAAANGSVLTFAVEPGADLVAHIDMRARHPGFVTGRIELVGGDGVDVAQLVYP